jgi:O-antigen ligase
MTEVPIFWEFGKYGVALLCLAGAVRFGRGRAPATPILYFVLLLPSAVITLADPLPIAMNNLSFNLSGPLALTASVLFFSTQRPSVPQYRRLLLVSIAPICGVSALTFQGLKESKAIEFGTQSNVASSGGFAPNQVSAVLGFGFALLALYLLTGPTRSGFRLALLCLLLVFGAQSAITFSRGGLYIAAGSLLAALVYLWREARSRRRLLIVSFFVVFASVGVVIPQLMALTHGAILTRFSETSTTGRVDIVHADLTTWLEHPIAGVGPGRAIEGRSRFFRRVASHTEFTRLLAEHGLLGVLAILCLAALVRQTLRRPGGSTERALRGAMLTWSTLFMLVDGMRLAAPGFAFGLAFVQFRHGRRRRARRLRGDTENARWKSNAGSSPTLAAESSGWPRTEPGGVHWR